jgi:hypothetical protein
VLICHACHHRCSVRYHDYGVGAGHHGSAYYNDVSMGLGSNCCAAAIVYFPDDEQDLAEMLWFEGVKTIDKYLDKFDDYHFDPVLEAGKEGIEP